MLQITAAAAAEVTCVGGHEVPHTGQLGGEADQPLRVAEGQVPASRPRPAAASLQPS